jgi:hypothetical protein
MTLPWPSSDELYGGALPAQGTDRMRQNARLFRSGVKTPVYPMTMLLAEHGGTREGFWHASVKDAVG